MRHEINATGEEWLRQFEAIRDSFLETMNATVQDFGASGARILDPSDDASPFGGHLLPVDEATGFVRYALDDGFCVAFAITRSVVGRFELWVSRWEHPEGPPAWVSAPSVAACAIHEGVFRGSEPEASA